jgi:flagellar basal-body rod modification protein FlgD
MTAITSSPVPLSSSGASTVSGAVDNTMIASNSTTFLQLLTTQLKNQNPLDPLDTNQFTQQLVQFAQVEQQMKSNDTLNTLVSIEKSAQSTSALALVGATVVVDGSTTPLSNGKAAWTFTASKPAAATVTIKDATGQTAYTGSFAVNAGAQNFVWGGMAITASPGRTATTPSPRPRPRPTPAGRPRRCRRKSRHGWIRWTSRRTRRSCPSMDRPTP